MLRTMLSRRGTLFGLRVYLLLYRRRVGGNRRRVWGSIRSLATYRLDYKVGRTHRRLPATANQPEEPVRLEIGLSNQRTHLLEIKIFSNSWKSYSKSPL